MIFWITYTFVIGRHCSTLIIPTICWEFLVYDVIHTLSIAACDRSMCISKPSESQWKTSDGNSTLSSRSLEALSQPFSKRLGINIIFSIHIRELFLAWLRNMCLNHCKLFKDHTRSVSPALVVTFLLILETIKFIFILGLLYLWNEILYTENNKYKSHMYFTLKNCIFKKNPSS